MAAMVKEKSISDWIWELAIGIFWLESKQFDRVAGGGGGGSDYRKQQRNGFTWLSGENVAGIHWKRTIGDAKGGGVWTQ